MSSILEQQVTELLTAELGRAPTAAEIADALIAPQTLARIHNSLNVTQSIFAVSPGDDLQAAIDKLQLNGGGILFLNPGTFSLAANLVVPSNVHVQGVGSGGSIIDFGGGAYQIQVIGTALTPVDSVFLGEFTVQNSSTDLIRVQYTNNFGGNDIASNNGLSGIYISDSTIFNWNIGYVDSCGTGMIMTNVDGMTVQNTFLSNISSGGGYICNTVTNSVLSDSSVDTCVAPGYQIINCSDFGIDEFSVTNISGNGIEINGGGEGFGLVNGLINNSSGDGLTLSNSVTQIQVLAVQFSNNTGYGVNVSDAGSTNNLFVGNTFTTNTAGAFNDLGTGTLIRSNVGAVDN